MTVHIAMPFVIPNASKIKNSYGRLAVGFHRIVNGQGDAQKEEYFSINKGDHIICKWVYRRIYVQDGKRDRHVI